MKKEDTKQRILDKALELFSSNGYDSVSMTDIANAVGIKAPSLYNHYLGKQAIFNAILEDTAAQYEEYTDKISIHIQDYKRDISVFSQITGESLLKKVHEIFLYSLHNERISRLRKMMTIEQFRSPSLSKLYSDRYVRRLVLYHADIFKNLINANEIKNENPEAMAMMYVAPINTLIGICDREPKRESECIKKLDEHVLLFYRIFRKMPED